MPETSPDVAPPMVQAFFNHPTNTVSYVVTDPLSRHCAVIDSVLDYDMTSGRTATLAADEIIGFVHAHELTTQWILETHIHADHLSAAPYLQTRLGGVLGIGEHIKTVQEVFGKLFNAGTEFQRDGSQFGRLFADEEIFALGRLQARALHTPGHTPACVSYVIGDAAFIGDTLFMPDSGSARADFPGGDARQLYRSLRRILALPPATRLFLCHDYKAPGRDNFCWETTVRDERRDNIHVRDGVTEAAFIALRTARDAMLGMPRLILPAVQVNMRAGVMPPPEADGKRYLKIPIDQF